MSITKAISLSLLLSLCGCNPHYRSDKDEFADSPDGKYRAYASNFAEYTYVDIDEPRLGRLRNWPHHSVYGCGNNGDASVKWIDSRTLIITGGCALDNGAPMVYVLETKYKDISIKYALKWIDVTTQPTESYENIP
jgi:hypothetical protein